MPVLSRYIVALLLLASVGAEAQKKLTLQDAVAMALENNYGLKIAENNQQIAELAYKASTANFLPDVTATVTNTKTKSDVKQELNTGAVINRNGANSSNINANIGAVWTVFDGLKMFATRERTKLLDESSTLALKQQMLNTVESVTLAYDELVRLKQQLTALEEVMKISEERIKIAQAKLDNGLAPKTDLLQSKIDYNAQLSNYKSQKALVPTAQEQLKQAIGKPELPDLTVDEVIVIEYIPNKQLIRSALESGNNQAKIAKNSMLVAEQQIREYRADMLPRLDLMANYNFTRANSQAGLILVNQNKGFNYGFNLSIPLFRGFAASKGLKIAELTAVQANLVYDDLVNQLFVETTKAYHNYMTDKELLNLEEENLKLAKENVFISLERFRQSQTSILELRQAQESLQDAQGRLITIRYNTKAAELRLRNLTGDLVK